jgi:glyoxylase-like metal-dependent hydrolase (beta-lactamase superfamily II)
MSLIREVAAGVYEISLAWSNAYLLWADGEAALIDTGLRRDRDRLMAALAQMGVAAGQLEAVYLTHAHCDHAGNAAYLAGRGAQLAVSRAEAPFMGLPRRTYATGAGAQLLLRPGSMLAFWIGEIAYPVERRVPDLLLDPDTEVPAPGGALQIIACPGHTPGHVAYYRQRDGLLFSGDAILNIVPFKRVTGLSLPIRGLSTNWTQTKRSAQHLATLRPQMLLPGHGWPLSEDVPARLAAWSDRLA